MTAADDELEASRRAFEARVDRRLSQRGRAVAPGKGSPAVLLTTGAVASLVLCATVLALGGGLLIVPALIPLVTVVGVVVARAVTARREDRRARS